MALWEKWTGICLPVLQRIFSWLMKGVEWLARPLVSNGTLVCVLFLLWGIGVWREAEYEVETGIHARHMLLDVYLLCVLLKLLPERWCRMTKWAIYIVVYPVTFFEVFLMERFRIIYTPTSINLWRETTWQESREFFQSYLEGTALWVTLGLCAALLMIHFLLTTFSRWWKTREQKGGSFLQRVTVRLIATAVVLVCAECLPVACHEKAKIWRFFTDDEQAEKTRWEIFYSPVYRLAYSWRMLKIADKDLLVLRRNMKQVEVDSCVTGLPHIVLVIGESYSKHHCQLFGYRSPTTPLMDSMRREGCLIPFDNAVTPWNLTSRVFKSLLSTSRLDSTTKWTDGVLFPVVLRKAGYRVSFLTNQFLRSQHQNGVDFNGSFFLNDPELDTLCFDVRNDRVYPLDGDFIKEYEKCRPTEKEVVIFHLYGQHTLYSRRYDKRHAYFTADSIRRKNLTPYRKQIVADYDNATRYNDEVFKNICDYFIDKDAVIVYLSDHGEEVFDYIRMFGRTPGDHIDASIAHYEFEIPMMMWFSPSFRQEHPDIVNRVRQVRHAPFISSNLSQFIFGLAGIRGKWYDSSRDILSSDYSPGPRLLKGQLSYDSIMAGSRYDKKKVKSSPNDKK